MTFKQRLKMALAITGAITIIWFMASFIQVVSQNTILTEEPTYSSWNMFTMIEEN